MPRIAPLAAFPLLCIAAAASAQTPACPALPAPQALACVSTGEGWFYAEDQPAAQALAEDARLAATTFSSHFGRAAPRGAIVAGGTGRALDEADRRTLRDAGAQWTLQWLDASERVALQRRAIERQLREKFPDADDARIAQMRDAALASTAHKPAGADTDRSALRHEVGHLLLIDAFWPDRESTGPVLHYGGPGPDWLDETAAVLMESETMANDRRKLLRSAEAAANLRPLPEFLSMQHPMLASVLAARRKEAPAPGGSSSTVRISTGEDGKRIAGQSNWFYVQSRGLADFLLQRAGTPAVFASIAGFAADGGDLAGWLQRHAAEFGLPASLDALDRDWQAWLAAPQGQDS